jgi:hypothetical protein
LDDTFPLVLTAAATNNTSSDPNFTIFSRTKHRRQTVISEKPNKTAVVIMMTLLPPFAMALRTSCALERGLGVAKMLAALKSLVELFL